MYAGNIKSIPSHLYVNLSQIFFIVMWIEWYIKFLFDCFIVTFNQVTDWAQGHSRGASKFYFMLSTKTNKQPILARCQVSDKVYEV